MSRRATAGIVVFALLVVASIGWAVWYSRNRPLPPGKLDAFAQCLREKGATMYGTYWCPHCQNEKKAFGNSFQYVPYVECSAEPQRCLDANVQSYPTWIFPDSRRFEGEQGLEKLSEESGCPLPAGL